MDCGGVITVSGSWIKRPIENPVPNAGCGSSGELKAPTVLHPLHESAREYVIFAYGCHAQGCGRLQMRTPTAHHRLTFAFVQFRSRFSELSHAIYRMRPLGSGTFDTSRPIAASICHSHHQ